MGERAVVNIQSWWRLSAEVELIYFSTRTRSGSESSENLINIEKVLFSKQTLNSLTISFFILFSFVEELITCTSVCFSLHSQPETFLNCCHKRTWFTAT